jgi:hypothetical protein
MDSKTRTRDDVFNPASGCPSFFHVPVAFSGNVQRKPFAVASLLGGAAGGAVCCPALTANVPATMRPIVKIMTVLLK